MTSSAARQQFWRRQDNKWSALQAWNFSHVATFVISLDKEETDFNPGCCFGPFNVFVRTPDARVFLITGIWCRICSRTGGFIPNQTSTSVHVVDNQNIVFPYACTLFLIVQLRSYLVLRL